MSKDKIELLMSSIELYYTENKNDLEVIKAIVNQEHMLSLRILDWFVTNYSKKNKTIVNGISVYNNYKLMLKSFSKSNFDPFCRKNKLIYEYESDNGQSSVQTSCGQMCFFRWCFQNKILEHVIENIKEIELDMKFCLKNRNSETRPSGIQVVNSISKQTKKYIISFD